MTVTARGARSSAPSPSPIAIGSSPRMVVAVVIRIGRMRRRPASTRASSRDIPSERSMFTASIRTMAFLTTIPASITAPIIPTTLTEWPVSTSARTAPMIPSGTVNMTTNGCRRDSNSQAITR